MRLIKTVSFALTVLGLVAVGAAQQVRADQVQIDLTITFIPPSPVIPPTPITQLTGAAFFGTPIGGAETGDFNIGGFDIGTLTAANPIFTANFIPTEPCFAGGTCRVDFGFFGSASGFDAMAFANGNSPTTEPSTIPNIPIGFFTPGDPCFSAGVCRGSGPIFAFDDALQVGTWDVSMHLAPTPLPGTLALFSGGLGLLGLLGWQRRRMLVA